MTDKTIVVGPPKPSKAEIVSKLAALTGLDRSTIKDLMKKGWYFDRQLDTGRMQFFSPSPYSNKPRSS